MIFYYLELPERKYIDIIDVFYMINGSRQDKVSLPLVYFKVKSTLKYNIISFIYIYYTGVLIHVDHSYQL